MASEQTRAGTKTPEDIARSICCGIDHRDYSHMVNSVAAAIASERAQHARLVEAAREMRAVIGVLFGHGENSIIPEQVDTPLGIPVKLRAITDEADAALSAEPASNADREAREGGGE